MVRPVYRLSQPPVSNTETTPVTSSNADSAKAESPDAFQSNIRNHLRRFQFLENKLQSIQSADKLALRNFNHNYR